MITQKHPLWIVTLLSTASMLGACSMTPNNPKVLLETNPSIVEAGNPAELNLSIQDGNGQPFQDLQISHEQLLHLIIISADFEEFLHLHPKATSAENTPFTISFTPKKSGKYLLATDFANSEKSFSDTSFLIAQGSPEMNTPENDENKTKTFADYEVSVTTPELKSGSEQTLKFSISQNREAVTNLQPYLAAPMHFAIVKDDLSHFVHTHGIIPMGAAMDDSTMDHHTLPNSFGPDIEAKVNFPEPGHYHLFGEFNHGGKVTTIHFQFSVK